SSFDLTIGATAAIAAAPHTPVPTPSKSEIFGSALNLFANQIIAKIENTITPASTAKSPRPSLNTVSIFNFKPYKIIAALSNLFDENAMPDRIASGYPNICLKITAITIAAASWPTRSNPGTIASKYPKKAIKKVNATPPIHNKALFGFGSFFDCVLDNAISTPPTIILIYSYT